MRCRRRRSEKAVIWHNMEWSITLLTISKTELSIFHLGMNRGRSLWICLAPDYFPGRRRDSWISCGIWNDHTGTDRLWGIQDVVSHFEKDSNRKRNLCRGAASWELWFYRIYVLWQYQSDIWTMSGQNLRYLIPLSYKSPPALCENPAVAVRTCQHCGSVHCPDGALDFGSWKKKGS